MTVLFSVLSMLVSYMKDWGMLLGSILVPYYVLWDYVLGPGYLIGSVYVLVCGYALIYVYSISL